MIKHFCPSIELSRQYSYDDIFQVLSAARKPTKAFSVDALKSFSHSFELRKAFAENYAPGVQFDKSFRDVYKIINETKWGFTITFLTRVPMTPDTEDEIKIKFMSVWNQHQLQLQQQKVYSSLASSSSCKTSAKKTSITQEPTAEGVLSPNRLNSASTISTPCVITAVPSNLEEAKGASGSTAASTTTASVVGTLFNTKRGRPSSSSPERKKKIKSLQRQVLRYKKNIDDMKASAANKLKEEEEASRKIDSIDVESLQLVENAGVFKEKTSGVKQLSLRTGILTQELSRLGCSYRRIPTVITTVLTMYFGPLQPAALSSLVSAISTYKRSAERAAQQVHRPCGGSGDLNGEAAAAGGEGVSRMNENNGQPTATATAVATATATPAIDAATLEAASSKWTADEIREFLTTHVPGMNYSDINYDTPANAPPGYQHLQERLSEYWRLNGGRDRDGGTDTDVCTANNGGDNNQSAHHVVAANAIVHLLSAAVVDADDEDDDGDDDGDFDDGDDDGDSEGDDNSDCEGDSEDRMDTDDEREDGNPL
jgi:hypothetical protein